MVYNRCVYPQNTPDTNSAIEKSVILYENRIKNEKDGNIETYYYTPT